MTLLAWVPRLTLVAMLLPVAAGLWGVFAPLFGFITLNGASAAPMADVLAWPGLPRAAWLSVVTGVGSTLIALGLVILILSQLHGSRALVWLRRALSPLLSVPHASAAFGLAFMIAPSGWIARAVSPWLTGWDRPPDLLILNDPAGIALTLGLAVKEMPFLLLMALAALAQTDATRSLAVARSLGHSGAGAWLKVVLPRLYGQIRLPVYVVLAYAMTAVDMALILGPTTPSTLSVQILRWMSDPDLTLRLQGAAGAVIQLSLVIAALSLWFLAEKLVGKLGLWWITSGTRSPWLPALRPLAIAAAATSAVAVLGGLASLAVWSFAARWQFPDALPQSLTTRTLDRFLPQLGAPLAETALIATTTTLIALILCIGCLEAGYRKRKPLEGRVMWLVYLPLLIPQIAFLPGLQVLLISGGLTMGRWVVILSHLVFVIPYIFLSLSDPWQAWNARHATVAHALGASPTRVLFAIRLPMLLAPILTAAAVGFAVSVGQYLPTFLAGGGRIATLTTEAVALASGGDRRAIGVYGIALTLAALLPFALALALPRILYANRRGAHP